MSAKSGITPSWGTAASRPHLVTNIMMTFQMRRAEVATGRRGLHGYPALSASHFFRAEQLKRTTSLDSQWRWRNQDHVKHFRRGGLQGTENRLNRKHLRCQLFVKEVAEMRRPPPEPGPHYGSLSLLSCARERPPLG